MRQKLSALGHWVRDHYYRVELGEHPHNRRHPVIDVLRFNPAKYYRNRGRGRGQSTLRDAYQAAILRPGSDAQGSDPLRNEVCCPRDSACLNKDKWYNRSKERVKEEDCDILKGVIARRLNDDSRESFGQEEYDKTKDRMVL